MAFYQLPQYICLDRRQKCPLDELVVMILYTILLLFAQSFNLFVIFFIQNYSNVGYYLSRQVIEGSLKQSDILIPLYPLLVLFWVSQTNLLSCQAKLSLSVEEHLIILKDICFHEVCFQEDFGIDFVVLVYTYCQISLGIAPSKGKAYIFGFLALIVEFKDLVQFIGWVALSCVCIDIVLDDVI